jgi:hypothetical protein
VPRWRRRGGVGSRTEVRAGACLPAFPRVGFNFSAPRRQEVEDAVKVRVARACELQSPLQTKKMNYAKAKAKTSISGDGLWSSSLMR